MLIRRNAIVTVLAAVVAVGLGISGPAGIAQAQEVPVPKAGDDLSSEDIIEALTPKTRGLSINTDSSQNTANTTAPEAPVSLNFSQIYFDLNSSALRADAKPILDRIGAALSSDQLASYRFSIIGHTDASGSADYNMTLSQRRANSVRDYLAGKFGIDRSRLQSVGRGESQLLNPAAPNDRTNRRVEIMNLGS